MFIEKKTMPKPCVEPKLDPVMVKSPLWAVLGAIDVTNGDRLDEYEKLKPVVVYEVEFVLLINI